MEVVADKSVKLFCMENGQQRNIATIPNAAKLDGTDVIEMVDVPGVTRFLLNGRMIGDVQGSPALGAQIGVMAYDIGMFGIANFSITSDGENLPTQPIVGNVQGAVQHRKRQIPVPNPHRKLPIMVLNLRQVPEGFLVLCPTLAVMGAYRVSLLRTGAQHLCA